MLFRTMSGGSDKPAFSASEYFRELFRTVRSAAPLKQKHHIPTLEGFVIPHNEGVLSIKQRLQPAAKNRI